MPMMDPTLSEGLEIEDQDYELHKVAVGVILLLLVFASGFMFGAVAY